MTEAAGTGGHPHDGAAGDVEFRAARLKERIYATITMIAVVLGMRYATHFSAVNAAVGITATAVSLWLATLVADAEAHRTVHQAWPDARQVRRMLAISSPLLASGIGPLMLVAVAAFGWLELSTALLVAVWVDVASLFVWGWLGGLRVGAGPVTALIAGALDTAIGLAVAAIKLLSH